MNTTQNKEISLYDAILSLKTSSELEGFLKDLCTPAELKAFKERWLIVQLLAEGKLSYREINEQTGGSTTTVSRVARFLHQEENQGYRLVLERIKQREK
jgi:TrpR-related protein YerC/YecD